ncbi:MFS transporter [Nocardioides renjunii]|uniref:MFS transporter n=1 Tax=Nocardioides renjunii TaxID=3095075 RepID=UPI002AFF511B|nr:MFS transporter [Nocardioides sp. S-34]WQQ20342.1 MFS transporter [Nocardioides sp. S-34]
MTDVAGPVEDGSPGASRRALRAACIGNTVEWYDFAVFGSLAIVITPVFFPAEDSTSVLLAAFAVYATAFLMRPVGAVLFGRIGDLRGRRVVFSAVLLLMTGATVAVGLLPGYARIGVLASVLIVVLRALQGLAAGGEAGLASVFITEHAAPGRRGATAAWQIATQGLGLALGFGLAAVLIEVLPTADHPGWWRLAFVLALPLGIVGFLLRRSTLESPHFVALARRGATSSSPVTSLWREHRDGIVAGFALAGTGALALNTMFVFVPNHVVATTGRSLSTALMTGSLGLVTAAGAALALGRLSDRTGRRPVVLTCLAALAVMAVPMAWLAARGGLLALLAVQVLAGIAIGGALSVAMVAEMFPTEVRVTGLAVASGLSSALLGGTAPLVNQSVVAATGFELFPGVYVACAAVAALLVLRTWPETAFAPLRTATVGRASPVAGEAPPS